MCYIIVVFWDGIGHTLQGKDTLLWYFKYFPKYYVKLDCAIKRAKRLRAKYPSVEKVVVYKIDATERFSCSDFCNWDDRIAFDTSNY